MLTCNQDPGADLGLFLRGAVHHQGSLRNGETDVNKFYKRIPEYQLL